MKKLLLLIIAITIIGIILSSGCTQPPGTDGTGGTGGTGGAEPTATQKGTIVLAIKDAAPDMSLFQNVQLKVTKISIHQQVTDSWIEISSQEQEFSLLELQDVQALLGEKDLNAGNYNQLRLEIESVTVDYNGATQEAKLPSNTLKLNAKIEIDANKTSIAVLDFDLNKSMHITGEGKIIMLPVIKIVAEKEVEIEIEDSKVKIKERGTKTDETEIGTDMDGNTGEDKKIGQDKELEIGADGKIKEKQQQGNGNGNEQGRAEAKGRIIATLKDKKPEGRLDVSEIKELQITIDSLTIHTPNSTDENTNSWIELLQGEKTFNLLELQNTEALLADMNVSAREFTQIRLGIKEATAVVTDTNSDQNKKTYSVKVPSSKLRINSRVIIDTNQTSYINLDFDLNKSLHVAGNDQIILKPVIKVVSKKGIKVKTEDTNSIETENGTEVETTETEFDESGNEE